MADPSLAESYPFLSSARRILEGKTSFSIAEIESAQNFSFELLSSSGDDFPVRGASKSRGSFVPLFHLSRLLAAASSKSSLESFSRKSARLFRRKLYSEPEPVLVEVLRDFLSSARAEENGFSTSVSDFLSSGLPLSQEAVSGGRVFFSRGATLSLLQQLVCSRISGIGVSEKKLPEELRSAVSELRSRLAVLEKPAKKRKGSVSFLSLPCISKIREGLSEGKRFYGAATLSIACLRDGLSISESRKVLEDYVSKCDQFHPFTEKEALAILEWSFSQSANGKPIGFSCDVIRSNGLGFGCENCPFSRKQAEAVPKKRR